jgi:predicted nucleic acid-binding protein
VADTEVLFALDPKDVHHGKTVKLLSSTRGVAAPDSALIEFEMVLRTMKVRTPEIRRILLALDQELKRHGLSQERTIDSLLLARQCELESKYDLSLFDSLIAASALVLDRILISDDEAFDRVPGLERISLG